MKKLFYLLVVLAAFGYGIPGKKEMPQMAGAYKMLLQVFTRGNKDTVFANTKQLKIYTPDYMIYANVAIQSGDTVSSFGFGPYTVSEGKVLENVIHGGSDTSIRTTSRHYTLEITKTAKGYKQFIPDLGESQGQKLKLLEEYENVGSAVKSPLDGAWKQVKNYMLGGKDTTAHPVTQYKVYQAGHFIWGRTYSHDGKNNTGVGFGTFTTNGNTKLKETIMASTYSFLNGQTVDIDIKMTGKDAFQQTFSHATGEKSVELYERLKKIGQYNFLVD